MKFSSLFLTLTLTTALFLLAMPPASAVDPAEAHTATGQALIKFPHHHDIRRLGDVRAELIAEKERDPADEVVLSEAKPKLKWDDGEHGMTGPLEFPGVVIPDTGYAYVRFTLTGKDEDGEDLERTFYSTRETLSPDDDGTIDLREVSARLPR